MILMPCPWCGPRGVTEFVHVGELTTRPDPRSTEPGEWRDYLFLRDNPCGWTVEQWHHQAGCRRYFEAERHTLTNEVRATRRPGRHRGADPPAEADNADQDEG